MIQDIFPLKLRNEFDKEAKACPKDTVLAFKGPEALYKQVGEEIVYPTVAELGEDREYTYLFSIDGERYFLNTDEDLPHAGYEYKSVRDIRKMGIGPRDRLFALYTGVHLRDWYRDNSFCGRCGHKMVHSNLERMMECKECGNKSYPRIMPAVIVGVTNGDKLLLTKYNRGFTQYALVAGFTEIGETVEETVAREVMEETGVKVKNIRYYKSQPWGIANDILLGFYCDVDGDTEIKMDSEELKFAEWVKREDIELQSDDFSLTNEMMKKFKDGDPV